MRLAKYLARAGTASRRASERLIVSGRVHVDGEAIRDPAHDVDGSQTVLVDGKEISTQEDSVTYAVHKPAGVVSTASDTHDRPIVTDLVKTERRLYPVGRLDVDTTGLILLTNDGELAYRLTHPRYEVPKTYRVWVEGGPVSEEALEQLRGGVKLEEGMTAAAEIHQLRDGVLELTIHEGRKRQIKRMCSAVGHPVEKLVRIRFGPLELADLQPGQVRQLTEVEIHELRKVSGL